MFYKWDCNFRKFWKFNPWNLKSQKFKLQKFKIQNLKFWTSKLWSLSFKGSHSKYQIFKGSSFGYLNFEYPRFEYTSSHFGSPKNKCRPCFKGPNYECKWNHQNSPRSQRQQGQIQIVWRISSHWFWVGPKHNFDSCFGQRWTWSRFKELSLRCRRLGWGHNCRCIGWFPCFRCKYIFCRNPRNGCQSRSNSQFLFSANSTSFYDTWSWLCFDIVTWRLCFKNEHGNQTRLHAISAIKAPLGWHLASKGDNTWEYIMVKCICWWQYDH